MSRTNSNGTHTDSPRPPAFTRQSSSRPAIRIRRLQARNDGSLSRGPLTSVPGGTRLSPIPPSPLSQSHTPNPNPTPKSAFAKVKSKLSHSSGPTGDVEQGPPLNDVLRPGEVAAIVRDGRGQPTLAAVPEDILPTPPADTHTHTRDRSRPDPHNSIPIPADPPSRDQPVICTETEEPSKNRKWWPFGKHKEDNKDAENASPPVARDYGAADGPEPIHNGQYAEDIVDWLDVIDPEVATVSTLSNVQNSLFLPDLGNLYNRMPIIDLSRRKRSKHRPKSKRRSTAQKMRVSSLPHVSAFAEGDEIEASERARIAQQALTREQEASGAAAAAIPTAPNGGAMTTSPSPMSPHRDAATLSPPQWIDTESIAEPSPDLSRNPRDNEPSWTAPRRRGTSSTLSRSPSQDSHSSHSSDSSSDSSTPDEQEMRRRERLMRSVSTIRGEYAVLPAGIAWDDWSEEEKAELDDHVRHLMHSRREKFRRRMRGFRRFVSRPLGFLITLYAFLITFWGAAWVLFLIGWIYLGDRKGYFVEIADQILTALFCVVGIGLAPFRVVDTYHMIYIAHYHHLTWRLRRERNLPKLNDRNDLPAPSALDPDLEAQFQKPSEAPVLTPEQQAKLTHHQEKYHKSHTFYRPHETPTHKAFPLSLLIAITVLLDCHSMLQMSLGATTWGIYYKNRPSALTATILSCSISCNLTAGFLISLGGRWSRKNEEVEKRVRQALTAEAMRNLEKQKRDEEALRRGEPVGLQASIGRRVERVQEKVKVQPREREDGDEEEKRGLTREESKDRREKGKEVPEHLTVPQMP